MTEDSTPLVLLIAALLLLGSSMVFSPACHAILTVELKYEVFGKLKNTLTPVLSRRQNQTCQLIPK